MDFLPVRFSGVALTTVSTADRDSNCDSGSMVLLKYCELQSSSFAVLAVYWPRSRLLSSPAADPGILGDDEILSSSCALVTVRRA